MAIVLGINCSGFHSSACLVIDGVIKYAITEERLSRKKQDKSFPLNAIQYCCDAANIHVDDIEHVFMGWNPGFYLHRSDNILQQAMQNRGLLSHLAVNELSRLQKMNPIQLTHRIGTSNGAWNIHFVNHHEAHLANGFLQSGFTEADFLVADGFGEVTAGFTGTVNHQEIKSLAQNRTPHSLGLFYSAFTQFLGFRPNSDEWKVMALASLGDPSIYYDVIRKMITVTDLHYEIDLSYFESFLPFTPNYYAPKLVALLGEPLGTNEEPGEREYHIVAAVQHVVEETIFQLLNNLHAKTGNKHLIVAGGVFMNSVANGKLYDETPYEEIFIGGSPDDSGISIGSALHGARYHLNDDIPLVQSKQNYFGRSYNANEIESELKRRKLRYRTVDNPTQLAAQQLRDKKIIAWFQGKSEFGQRALGNRSILADPTYTDMKDLVNATIKYREGFRPFAPAVLSEHQHNLFNTKEGQTAYFMEKVFAFQDEWQPKLPAVVHFDGSGRLQTVERQLNPPYHDLISHFYTLSECPVILNTSFNVSGMPLVETPSNAIDCFYQSGLDTLIMENYVIEK